MSVCERAKTHLLGGVPRVSGVVDKFITLCGRSVNRAKHKHIPRAGMWIIYVIRLRNINNTKDPVAST